MWSLFSTELLQKISRSEFKESQLNLSEQKLTIDKIELLVEALNSNPYIKSVALAKTELDDKCACILANAKHVEVLLLGDNDIGDLGAISLAKMKQLKKLHLNLNFINDAAAEALAENLTLIDLDVSENGITSAGAKEFLRNNSLKTLFITGNRDIDDETYAKLKLQFETDHVEELTKEVNYGGSHSPALFKAALSSDVAIEEKKEPSKSYSAEL